MTSEQTTQKTLPSAFSLIGQTVEVIKRNASAFTLMLIAPALLQSIGLLIPTSIDGNILTSINFWLNTALSAICGLFLALAEGGVILAIFKSLNNEDAPAFQTFVAGLKYFWRLMGVGIITTVLLSLAFLVFIVPFFILLPHVLLANYYVIDRNMGPIQAFKASFNESKPYSGAIWGLIGVMILLIIAGMILMVALTSVHPVIGSIAFIPFTLALTCAPVIRYKQISDLQKADQTVA